MNNNYLLLLLLSSLTISCTEHKGTEKVENTFPDELGLVLEAHGGYDQWKEMNSLTYRFVRGEKNELHQTDLKTRKAKIEGNGFTIGFDGKKVWVSPNKAAYSGSSARFYHNLIFYFYAMPFLLSDPGIQYEVGLQREIKGKEYRGIKVSYGEGVGDAPDDEYILYYDPNTYHMEWLFYTVTYFSKEKGKSYNAIHYHKWKETNGLLLPEKMTGYRTENDTVTVKRYDNLFSDVVVSPEKLDESLFTMPLESEIDSLK